MDKMLGRELVLNRTVLNMVNGSVQHILDCVPLAASVVLSVKELPIRGELTFDKPITFTSVAGTVKLRCSEGGIQIRFRKCSPDSTVLYPDKLHILIPRPFLIIVFKHRLMAQL